MMEKHEDRLTFASIIARRVRQCSKSKMHGVREAFNGSRFAAPFPLKDAEPMGHTVGCYDCGLLTCGNAVTESGDGSLRCCG